MGLVALLAVLLPLPSLRADLYTDDQFMVLTMDGLAPAPIPGPFHLYTFMSGAPGERDALVSASQVPWWSADGIRISFCRPLSSALLTLDHALSGRNPLAYHVHAVAWYVAAALAAAWLFQKLLPAREAGVAALLFVSSPAHWMLGAWPAARHVAISGTFAILALLAHIELRTRARQSAALIAGAAVCAVLSLAAGETALGLFGYVAAYELLARREPLSASRLARALAPWAALFVAYAASYVIFSFGVRGVGAYIDPIRQPAAFLAALPARFLVYASAALLCIPAEVSMIAPRGIPLLCALGAAALAGLVVLARRALRSAPELAPTLKWLACGALFAILPGIASIPGDRVLFLPDLVIAPALAVILLHAWNRAERGAGVWFARVGLCFFGLVHLVVAPLEFAGQALSLASTSHEAITAATNAEIPARADLSVIGIGLADPLVGMYLPSSLYIAPRPEPRPRAVQLLSMAAHDHRVARTGEQTLEITVLGGTLLDDALAYLFRGPDSPLHPGDVTPIGAWRVRVLAVDAGRPTRFALELDRSANDPSLVFLIWREGALRALTPPAVGQSVIVKHEPGPLGI